MMARLSRAGWRTLSSLLLGTQFGRACDRAVGGRGSGGLGGRCGAVFGADSDTFTHDLREWGSWSGSQGRASGTEKWGGRGGGLEVAVSH